MARRVYGVRIKDREVAWFPQGLRYSRAIARRLRTRGFEVDVVQAWAPGRREPVEVIQ